MSALFHIYKNLSQNSALCLADEEEGRVGLN